MTTVTNRDPMRKPDEEERRQGDSTGAPLRAVPPDADAAARLVDFEAERARRVAPAGLSIGSRTLFDLPYGPAEAQLVEPFLAPDGVTVLYGPGGVGKGMVAVWLALQLVRDGRRVLVLDYESHAREWGRRARSMGYSDDELAMVAYRAPTGADWTAKTGAITDIADALRDDCAALSIDYLIVDSYVAATSTGDTMGGVAGAQDFFGAIARIGLPCLTIAHVAGGQSRFPDKPFGSIFVRNFARETWAIEANTPEDQETYDPTTKRHLPQVIELELRQTKNNNGPRAKPQHVSFSFFPDFHIEVDSPQPRTTHINDQAFDILVRAKGEAKSVKELVEIIRVETGETVKPDSMRDALTRDNRVRKNDALPAEWVLR